MAEIKIGVKTYAKISDVTKSYLETEKQLKDLTNEIKSLKQLKKQLLKFFKDNGLEITRKTETGQGEQGNSNSKTES